MGKIKLTNIIGTYIKLKNYPFEAEDDDSKIDKLSRRFSAITLFIFSSLLGVVNVVGAPIQCWCLGEFKGKRCTYAKQFCYVTGTYVPIGNTTELPRKDDLLNHKIFYYQWVPYIFLLQSFMFYSPHLIWSYLNRRSCFELKNYIKVLRSDDSDIKNSTAVKYVVSHMKSCIDYHKSYQSHGLFYSRHLFKHGTYLSTCHFLIKCLYALNAFTQIYLLNYWLRDSYYSNLPLLATLFGAHNFRFSERFPRMTLCKFQVYILADDQINWMQCALPVNIYIEKMYIIIWPWLWILLLIIMFDLIRFIFEFWRTKSFVKNRLIDLNQDQLDYFSNMLSKDCVLTLRLLNSNTNDFYVNSILSNLVRSLKSN